MLLRPSPLSSPFPPHFLLAPSRRNPSFLLLVTPRHRRRRKPRSFLIHSSLDELISTPSSLYLLAPAIGFISGAALFLSSYNPGANFKADSGASPAPSPFSEWVLFTSPTPFNRSVLLRCPSVSFEDGGELLDGVNDRLLIETRHCVNFSSSEIPGQAEEDAESESELLYQRVCVRTKDGGVLSVDWPENLDLRKEHGLDTTVVVVPGTTQGSMDRRVKFFVLDALRHGYFPVVMNPRGCAGSPVTTPRLFTAADSDDISTVVRFLNTMRPWTTLVGVSWGYGSNMLTKYLAEVGDSTPLTAAVCINNPFDLDEATWSIPYGLSLDQELLSGLIDIMKANKELFVGKGKGFDVQKALSAATLRDFDEAISMVSHGCDSVEQFYAKINTRQSIQNVKTPILFIESGNGNVPVFSIPRTEISENPFTSLLLSSYLTSGTIRSDQMDVMWIGQLAIEWLSAVELAFLKGRHPLLEDIDISINPSKDFSFVKGAKSKPERRYKGSSSLPINKAPSNGYLIAPPVEVDSTNGKVGKSSEKAVEGSEDVKEEEVVEGEDSQVLQTATVVMNMLDVTMPGTLNDEQKKKVLTAMGRGETLIKALEGAVPEDVRGKLTTVASEIIQAQKSNLSLNVLKQDGGTQPPLDLKPKIQDNSTVIDSTTHDGGEVKDASSLPEQSASNPENSIDTGMANQEKGMQNSADGETAKTVPIAQDQQPQISNLELEGGQKLTGDELPTSNDANTPKDEVKKVDAPTIEQSAPAESPNPNPHETEHKETEGQVNETSRSKDVATTPSNAVVEPNLQNSPSKIEEPSPVVSQPPPINVGQALDALTGFDDSTQMAVTSVFGVLENMIDQLEKKQDNDENATDAKESKDAQDQKTEVRTEEHRNKVKVGQDEINHSTSSNEIEGDSQKEMSNGSIISPLKSTSNLLKERDLSHDYLKQDFYEKLSSSQKLYWSMQYTQFLPLDVEKQLEAKELDSDTATDLILDPQEGMWKLDNEDPNSDIDSETSPQLDNVVEPSYVILETSTNETPNEEENIKFTATREQVALFIREELLGALETDVCRKLGVSHLDIEKVDATLVCDIEELATSVSQKVVQHSELNLELFSRCDIPKGKIGTIQGEYLIKTVSRVVHESNHLRRLLPVGLVVGSMLACLRKYFELSESHGDGEIKLDDSFDGENYHSEKEVDLQEEEQNGKEGGPLRDREKELEMDRRQNQGIMVGTVTAALGASALLVQHQNEQSKEQTSSTSNQNFVDEAPEKNSSLVSSLTEKAMSVAGSVIPTKSNGGVDLERLVAVLAELGQRGGILRLVGKLALLWGGIRGAMSLTDRLISFLHIGERPLLHRLLGFGCMALLLWSPVVIPLLPTLVQCWAMKASTGIVGDACVIGLYAAVTILVIIWGKRIRGYEDPVVHYGLDVMSTTRVCEFFKGLAGGVMVVLSVHLVNSLLGYAHLSWPLNLPPFSLGSLAALKAYSNLLVLVVRGLLTATGVSLVEELLFRSWLQKEIAVDYGYYPAILFSGIAFSLIHRSVYSIPVFLLLSVALAGIKQQFMGKLAAPIGLRAGIMSTSYTLYTGGFITYKANTPFWLNSTHPQHPFHGAVGLGICLMLAIIFLPRERAKDEGDST
ncbi:alpha/beta-Hydrolases superfamily protein isoform X3 [Carex rostrata]